MKTIFGEMLYAMEKGQDTVLVTIVGEDGSVPRGTGSMMLVGRAGRMRGSVGGGAVEETSVRLAMELIGRKESLLHQYILRKNNREDLGMVCGGDVSIWFQFVSGRDEEMKRLATAVCGAISERRAGWLVLDLKGGTPFLIDENRQIVRFEAGTSEQPKTEETAPEALLVKSYTGTRIGDLYAIPFPVGERAVIFGGGHIARALVPVLVPVGFRCVVYDNRPEYTDKKDFSAAEQVICASYETIADHIEITPEDYVIVMTNGHSHDMTVELQMLRQETAYIGVIGSSRKTAAVNAKLREAGISPEKTATVHTPIGTRIKAVTPEEIAISIAGEMILVRAEIREQNGELKKGCPMR